MTNGKIVALTIQTFVGKVMSLPFNMLSMFAIDILPRNKRVFNSWLHSLFTVILESMKLKSVSASKKKKKKKIFLPEKKKKFTEQAPSHQNKTQFPPQSVSPIRKIL